MDIIVKVEQEQDINTSIDQTELIVWKFWDIPVEFVPYSWAYKDVNLWTHWIIATTWTFGNIYTKAEIDAIFANYYTKTELEAYPFFGITQQDIDNRNDATDPVWWEITGNLSDQTDLQIALNEVDSNAFFYALAFW